MKFISGPLLAISRVKVIALIEKKGSSGCGEIFSLLTTLVKGSPVSNGFLTCTVTQSFSTLSLLRNWLSLVAGQTGFYAQVVSGVVGFLVWRNPRPPLPLPITLTAPQLAAGCCLPQSYWCHCWVISSQVRQPTCFFKVGGDPV